MKRWMVLMLILVLTITACGEVAETPVATPTVSPAATMTPEEPDPTAIPDATPTSEPPEQEDPDDFEPVIALQEIATGLTAPVDLKVPADGTGRRFVVDQVGLIYVIDEADNLLGEPFLDLQDRMVTLSSGYDERGLLGMDFHPDYAENGRFFVYYSAPLRAEAPQGWNHTSHLSEFTVSSENPDQADPETERIVMAIDQPQSNHNSGSILFGPDGYLYVGLGDGGGANDTGAGHVQDWYEINQGGNAQAVGENLLGSILRIDVDAGEPYAIPEDNPFVDDAAGLDEAWAYGFRNPYRMAFDPGGDNALFVADAGQDLWEEVSIVTKGNNYGWNVKEGTDCFSTAAPDNPDAITDCPDEDPLGNPLIDPIIEFPHSRLPDGLGLVIVGGNVYRGSALPAWDGRYIFGQWSRSWQDPEGSLFVAQGPVNAPDEGLWDFEPIEIAGRENGELNEFLLAFGQDVAGEIYVLTSESPGPAGDTGRVYRIVPPEGAGAGPEAEELVEVEVVMEDIQFRPQELTIAAGTTVVWRNQDNVLHTVTAGTRGRPTDLFDAEVPAGESFSFTFDEPGTYDYYCRPHSGMAGTVVVEQ